MAITSQPAPTKPHLPIAGWGVTALLVLLMAGGAEAFLRSGQLWHLPLPYLTRENDDVHARTAWRIANLRPQDNEIVVLGASTADAVVEPRGKLQQAILDRALGGDRAALVNLSVNRSCYAEQTVVADNMLEEGHRPRLVLLFTWPGCASRDPDKDDFSTLTAARFPLVSHVLDDSVPYGSFEEGLQRWLAYHVRLVRFRYFINGWLRQRTKRALHGRLNPWLPFKAANRSEPWGRSWPDDGERYALIHRYAAALQTEGPQLERLEFLLHFFHTKGVPVLVIESPWSPPMFDAFAPSIDRYEGAVVTTARRQGAAYFNPNRVVRLDSQYFHDSYHVTDDGAALYMETIAARLRDVLR